MAKQNKVWTGLLRNNRGANVGQCAAVVVASSQKEAAELISKAEYFTPVSHVRKFWFEQKDGKFSAFRHSTPGVYMADKMYPETISEYMPV